MGEEEDKEDGTDPRGESFGLSPPSVLSRPLSWSCLPLTQPPRNRGLSSRASPGTHRASACPLLDLESLSEL